MITHLTYKLAFKIASGTTFSLDSFYKNGLLNEYFMFTHYNFFYSYPEFGKQWPDNKSCEFHKVNTCCNSCLKIPERNYAGVGTIFIMKSSHTNRDFVLLCNSCKQWRNTSMFDANQKSGYQLQLF